MKSAIESVVRLKKPETEALLVAVSCNKCGQRHVLQEPGGSFPDDLHIIELSGGWGDRFPSDLCVLRIIVCSDCLKSWCDSFTIPADYRWTGPGSLGNPYEATHSETHEAFIIERGWARPAGSDLPSEPYSWSYDEGDDFPRPGIYRHFKGNHYEIVEHVKLVGTNEPMVVYRALYGESRVWVRPVWMWDQEIIRDGYRGPRFIPWP